MNMLRSMREALKQRRRTAGIALAVVLALALGVGLTVLTGVLMRSNATGAQPNASGFATQDLDGLHAQAAGGQTMRAWAERCAGMADKYHFDRNDLTYTTGDGDLRAGGRISLYLITEDDDEYAPPFCRGQSAY